MDENRGNESVVFVLSGVKSFSGLSDKTQSGLLDLNLMPLSVQHVALEGEIIPPSSYKYSSCFFSARYSPQSLDHVAADQQLRFEEQVSGSE